MKKSIHDEIAKAAYERYEKRGRVQGHELKDWFEAENSVMEKHEKHAKEMEKKVVAVKKPPEGHRRTVKKEGFYKKG